MPKELIKIAIVDDAPFIREILKTIAKSQGWMVAAEAENGKEAVDLVLRANVQVVLMDIVMPIKNGIEATQAILSRNSNIKIIACSTMDQESILLKAIENGCCSYLTKPFNKDEVIKAVEDAIKIKEAS